jgi:hypothetical protein
MVVFEMRFVINWSGCFIETIYTVLPDFILGHLLLAWFKSRIWHLAIRLKTRIAYDLINHAEVMFMIINI